MARLRKEILGLEAINFQGKDGRSDLFKELVTEIGVIRANTTLNDRAVVSSRLAVIISNHTGISTEWHLDEAPYINAYVYLPDINKNHPLALDYERAYLSCSTLNEFMKTAKNGKFKGVVDRERSMVYGDFTKIQCAAYITKGMFDAKGVSDSNIAAVILHELGHVFTSFEYVLGTVTLNYASAVATNEILGTDSPKLRMEILTRYEKFVGVTLDDKETIVKSEDGSVILTQVLTDTYRNKRDVTGMPIYSYNACEFVADQFAVRHGAGLALAQGLDAIYRKEGDISTKGWIGTMLANILNIITLSAIGAAYPVLALLQTVGATITAGTVLGIGAAGAALMLVIVLCMNPIGGIYDSPKDRTSRIIREYNVALKDPKISHESRNYYLQQLNQLYVIEKSLKNNMFWNEAIWAYLVPAGRKAKRQEEFQQTLEKLSNNSLFAASAAFK